jgi:hypothetical protein
MIGTVLTVAGSIVWGLATLAGGVASLVKLTDGEIGKGAGLAAAAILSASVGLALIVESAETEAPCVRWGVTIIDGQPYQVCEQYARQVDR